MGCVPCSKKRQNIVVSQCPQKIKRLKDLKTSATNKALQTDDVNKRQKLLEIVNTIDNSLEKQYSCPSTETINNIKYAISQY